MAGGSHLCDAETDSSVEEARRLSLQPKLSLCSATGYAGVGLIKGKYQARFFDKSRGKQRAVPGLYKTALEAALALAWAKHLVKAHAQEGEAMPSPAKRKSRLPSASPKVLIMPIAMAMPVEAASPRIPFASVQPVAGVTLAGMAGPVASWQPRGVARCTHRLRRTRWRIPRDFRTRM